MSIKDLFGKKSNKILSAKTDNDVNEQFNSTGYSSAQEINENRFFPNIDFTDPANWARYGSAEKYYNDAIASIYQTYPYDGTFTEKQQWVNSSSYIDEYIFENEYPRTTGFIDVKHGGFTAFNDDKDGSFRTFRLYDNPQYIKVKGGPNVGPDGDRIGANIYDEEKNRLSNLRMSPTLGNTVEFWLSASVITTGSSSPGTILGDSVDTVCLFDLWNQNTNITGSSYGRFMIEAINQSGYAPYQDNLFVVTYLSGTTGAEQLPIGNISNIQTNTPSYSSGSWNHYAISAYTSGSETVVELYINGTLTERKDTATVPFQPGGAPSEITGALNANIGAYQYAPNYWLTASSGGGTVAVGEGWGSIWGGLDEFRFWKEKRTPTQIGRSWFTQIGGGNNVDDLATSLGVYFKFNEGILNTTSIDSQDATVLDYSGRISNGTIQNYAVSPATRYTGSAMDISTLVSSDIEEFRDPIVYSTHPQVVSLQTTKQTEGQNYDTLNNTGIFTTLPEWIAREDEGTEKGELKNLTQIIGSYFDSLHLQIEAVNKIKDTDYFDKDNFQFPYKFVKRNIAGAGFPLSDLFVDSNLIEEVFSRDEEIIYDDDLFKAKNLIYQNIYNNLVYIYKSKGTEKSFRNLIRCFGVDEELVSINTYADNTDYLLEDDRRNIAVPKTYINFNDPDRWDSTVYQQTASGDANTIAYIPAASGTLHDYIPYTVEAEVILPKGFSTDSQFYDVKSFYTSSIFGSHEVNTSSLDWSTNDYGNFQVYVIKEEESELSNNAYFQLVSDGFGPTIELTSSIFNDAYNNNKWNLAVSLKPASNDLLDLVSGSVAQSTNYILEFRGYNSTLDIVENQFMVTASINNASASLALNANKRLYAGSHRQNYTGSALANSDVKISSVRYWLNYLEDETIRDHSFDASSYGAASPYRSAYFQQTSIAGSIVPEIKTLVLNWDFSTVTGSDANSKFSVNDLTSGSLELTNRYGWLDDIIKYQYPAEGNFWLASNNEMVDREYVNSMVLNLPENLNASNTVDILTESEDQLFPKGSRPITYFFAAEKSMYQTVSREMVKMFASIAGFQNLIGEPVNRYRMEYKDLGKLRQLFFENIENTPSLEKYVEFYKWIDSALNLMIQDLIPASTNFSPELRTMVESHVLERNKYWTKFPTLEQKAKDPEGSVRAINELTYNWKNGHPSPTFTGEDDECLWYSERAERDGPDVTSGDATVDAQRQTLLDVKTNDTNGSPIDLYDEATDQTYQGNTYAIRRLSKPYRFAVQLKEVVHGGVNTPSRKKPISFLRSVVKPETSTGLRVFTNVDDGLAPLCDDDEAARFPLNKRIIDGAAQVLGQPQGYLNRLKASFVSPDSDYYDTNTNQRYNANTHVHNDSYGPDGEIPMQGPFTRTHVGGSQHRHVDPNQGSDSALNRAELYRVDVQADYRDYLPPETNNPKAAYYRDELAKRPVNIRNIRWGTGSYWIGNFRQNYEVVQTVGRSTNNRYFTRNGGIDIVPTSSAFITGLNDFALPDRGRTESIFVNRFAAPGDPTVSSRGSLDVEAEEYSVYNDLNWRNRLVRDELDKWLTYHSEWNASGAAGMSSDPNVSFGTPSYHKIQRNTRRTFRLSGTSETETICEENYDNFWVQHAIPQSDYQYRWIDAGALTSSCPMGYVSDYPNLSTTITFALTTASFTPYYPPAITGSDLHDRLVYRDGIYQYASWQQIRTGDMIEARNNKKNNIITVQDRPKTKTITGNSGQTIQYVDRRSDTTSSYTEPPVSINRPIYASLTTPGATAPSIFAFTHVNNLETFGNLDLENRQGIRKNELQFYNHLHGLYNTDPNTQLRVLNHRETTYPAHRNVGLKKIRLKENYEEIAGTGSNGYDRNSGIIRSFWRDSIADRKRTQFVSSNSFGQVETVGNAKGDTRIDSVWALDLVSSSAEQIRGDLAYVGFDRYKDVWITGSFDGSGIMDVDAANTDVRNAIQLIYNPYTASADFAEGGWQWKTQEISGKKPAYDTYEKYIEDVKLFGQMNSIVPEYKISDHIEFYIKQNDGDFLAKNPNFLKIDGGTITSSQSPTDSTKYNDEFFKVYSHSDFMRSFARIYVDHTSGYNGTAIKKMSINVNGVKKLLPYNGFYPSQRTVQLSRLFMDSYGVHFTGSQEPGSLASDRHTKQAALQPFFAPGILYNTIKSGIAVDWATFQGSVCPRVQNDITLGDLTRIDSPDQTNGTQNFGLAVSVGENYIAVGAPRSSAGTTPANQGLAYLYGRVDGGWSKLQDFTTPGGGEANARFGNAIAFDKDDDWLFISAYDLDDGATTDAGKVFAFPKDGGTYDTVSSIVTITAPTPSANDNFGFSIDASNNVLIVGEPSKGSNDEGTAYIFYKDNGGTNNWGNQAQLFPFGGVSYNDEFFGRAVAISGETAAVSGPGADDMAAPPTGSVYIYYKDQGGADNWGFVKQIQATSATHRYFGFDIALDCDYLVVGENPDDADPTFDTGDYIGQVSIYKKDQGGTDNWGLVQTITDPFPSNPSASGINIWNNFGKSVSLSNGILVIGANAYPRGGIQAVGRAYIYTLSETEQDTFVLNQTIENPRSVATDFGVAVDINKGLSCFGAPTYDVSDSIQLVGEVYTKFICNSYLKFRSDACDLDGDGSLDNFAPTFYNQNVASANDGRVIVAEPNLRLPFESILTLNNNVPEDRNIWMMAPEYYTGSAAAGSDYVYPYFRWDGETSSPLYDLAANNFLAEIPKFFLQKQGLTTFKSVTQANFDTNNAVSGATYYMDVNLYKTNLEMTLTPFSGSDSTKGRYFGPSALYNDSTASYGSAQKNSLDPAFAPWTPPYFYGRTTARIKFTAQTNNPTVDEIFANSTVEYLSDQIDTVFTDAGDIGTDGTSPGSVAYNARMNISASVQLFGKTIDKNETFSPGGGQTAGDGDNKIENTRWTIYTKFECPVLNFDNDANRSQIVDTSTLVDDPEAHGIGMWSGYGEIPGENSQIVLSISETPEADRDGGESLIKLCGFKTTNSAVGKVANERTISEAVVMIPFLEKATPQTIQIENATGQPFNFFSINQAKFQNALSGQTIGSTINPMIDKMKRYNIPPNFDFVNKPKEIPPFVMYIFEFEHTLTQQDLVDIWQGVLPEIGTRAQKDSASITHTLDADNFFGGLAIPEKTRWMVFKVKRKAAINYYELTDDAQDDDRFTFQVGTRTLDDIDYSYNYPYDYFSLVETIQADSGLDVIDNTGLVVETSSLSFSAAEESSQQIQSQIQEAQSGVSDAEQSSQQTPVASQKKSPLPGIFGLAADPEDN